VEDVRLGWAFRCGLAGRQVRLRSHCILLQRRGGWGVGRLIRDAGDSRVVAAQEGAHTDGAEEPVIPTVEDRVEVKVRFGPGVDQVLHGGEVERLRGDWRLCDQRYLATEFRQRLS